MINPDIDPKGQLGNTGTLIVGAIFIIIVLILPPLLIL